MKVKDLIELLSTQPEDMNVYFYSVDNHFAELKDVRAITLTNLRYLKVCTADSLNDDLISKPQSGYRRVAEYESDFDQLIEIDPKNYTYTKDFVIFTNDPNIDVNILKNKHYVDVELPELYRTQQDEDLRRDAEEYKEFIRLSQKFTTIVRNQTEEKK